LPGAREVLGAAFFACRGDGFRLLRRMARYAGAPGGRVASAPRRLRPIPFRRTDRASESELSPIAIDLELRPLDAVEDLSERLRVAAESLVGGRVGEGANCRPHFGEAQPKWWLEEIDRQRRERPRNLVGR